MSHHCGVQDFYTKRLQGNVLGVGLLHSSDTVCTSFHSCILLSKYALSSPVYLDQVFCVSTGSKISHLYRTATLCSVY